MPTPTYDLIASNVLGSSASSVTFSSIPATYRDLIVVVDAASTTASPGASSFRMTFNSDSGANYSYLDMSGDGSSASSSSTAGDNFIRFDGIVQNNDTQKTMAVVQIMDYSATDKHKTVLSRANKSNNRLSAVAGRWASTSAINSITFATGSNNYASGGTFYLYGIVS
jgi:hypothetical protein